MSGKRLAIIPARGGSKRIPGKNVRDFFGKPMIHHILNTAQNSGLFDTIHVSTDDEQIKTVVESTGLKIDFLRPESLADDHTPIMPVVQFVAKEYMSRGEEYSEIWLLMACAPLLTESDLHEAAEVFQASPKDRILLAIAPFPVPVEWAFSRTENGALIPREPSMFAVRSQDLPVHYYDTGTFAIYPVDQVLSSQGAGNDFNFLGHILDPLHAVDIDSEEDWKRAEVLFAAQNAQTGNTE